LLNLLIPQMMVVSQLITIFSRSNFRMVMNLLFVILTLTSFFRTVGIIVIVYYGLKFIGRLLFPIVVKKAVDNLQARQTQYQRQQQNKQEGEVTIEKNRGQQNRSSKAEGEYVDFEEIE
jgi:hypothetical protein